MIKASVIIPTYKPKAYIYECLDSIFAQTCSASNYEIIIVLNGCCEPYYSQLQDYLKHAPCPEQVHLVQTDTPGVSNARNMALAMAKGDYILFIDDDDLISPTYMEGLLALSAEDTIVASRLRLFDDVTGEESNTNLTNAYHIAKEEMKVRPLSLYTGRRFLSAVGGKSIPRKMIGERKFNTQLSLGEDSIFITRLTSQIKHILLAPEDAVYSVRKREDSASRKPISNCAQVHNALTLTWEYIKMYFSDVCHNDFKFYMSRIVASLLKAFLKKYRTV